MKKLIAVASCLFALLPCTGVLQPGTPVLWIHPRQLVNGGNALEGQCVKMEVVFFYRAFLQQDSLFQKCTVEGKFRQSGKIEDEVVLYNVLIPDNIFLRYYAVLTEGSCLTLAGIIRKSDGPWTRFEVFELSEGWKADSAGGVTEMREVFPFQKLFAPDSSDMRMKSVMDSSRKVAGKKPAVRKPDSSARKSKGDSAWVK